MTRRAQVAWTAFAVTVLLAAGGCGDTDPSSGGVDLGGSWRLVDGRDDAGDLDLSGREVTLAVDGAEVGGTSACNLYGGRVDVSGTQVSFTDLGGTEMACDPPVMELEQRYLTALQAVERGHRDGDHLVLSGPDVRLELTVAETTPDVDLVGTRWVLDSIVDGETASSSTGEAGLRLLDDGTLRGTTGCGSVRARYSLRGDEALVDHLAERPRTHACSDEAERQHQHVVDVLSGGFGWRVEEDRLTVTDTTGLGLGLHAE